MNLPGAKIDLPAVTDRDKADIAFGVRNRVDFIAASFIRRFLLFFMFVVFIIYA